MYASCWRLHVRAISNVLRTMIEAASTSGKEQSTSIQCEKILEYLYRKLSAPLYKASAAKQQAREAVYYSCKSLLSNLKDWKKHYKARFTRFNIYTPSM